MQFCILSLRILLLFIVLCFFALLVILNCHSSHVGLFHCFHLPFFDCCPVLSFLCLLFSIILCLWFFECCWRSFFFTYSSLYVVLILVFCSVLVVPYMKSLFLAFYIIILETDFSFFDLLFFSYWASFFICVVILLFFFFLSSFSVDYRVFRIKPKISDGLPSWFLCLITAVFSKAELHVFSHNFFGSLF